MSKRIKSYPPVGSPDRLDEIMDRGAGMRRRRRMVGVTSAGVMGVACLVLVMTLGAGLEPSTRNVATAADGATNGQVLDETPEPTTPAEPPEFVSFAFDETSGELRIDVHDPETPTPVDRSVLDATSYEVQQCVLVTLTRTGDGDPYEAEAFACRQVVTGTTVPSTTAAAWTTTPFELVDATEVAVGCPAIEERFDAPVQMTTTAAQTRFVTSLVPSSAGLPAGEYSITVAATSGFGDGCPGGGAMTDDATSGAQVENTETVTGRLTIG